MILIFFVSKFFSQYNIDFIFQIFVAIELFFTGLMIIGAGVYIFNVINIILFVLYMNKYQVIPEEKL